MKMEKLSEICIYTQRHKSETHIVEATLAVVC